jgi:glutathionyl-hydroquinone reductase
MGLLVDGKWQDVWYDTASSGGRFIRSQSQFRNWITTDASPGPSGQGGSRQSRADTICMSASLVRGRIACGLCGCSRDSRK